MPDSASLVLGLFASCAVISMFAWRARPDMEPVTVACVILLGLAIVSLMVEPVLAGAAIPYTGKAQVAQRVSIAVQVLLPGLCAVLCARVLARPRAWMPIGGGFLLMAALLAASYPTVRAQPLLDAERAARWLAGGVAIWSFNEETAQGRRRTLPAICALLLVTEQVLSATLGAWLRDPEADWSMIATASSVIFYGALFVALGRAAWGPAEEQRT